MGSTTDDRKVLFVDIDNCLYPKSTKVFALMSDLIDEYFATHLSLSLEDANELHRRYYKDYGLAIEGLVRHHKVDPLEYNRKVDDALPLDDIIKPNPQLRSLLDDVDRSKVKLWLLTNAYITHGKRVVNLLQVEDCFEGITYCDYGAKEFVCKPHKNMYLKAMKEAGVEEVADCYFVDDSYINAKAAQELGWTTAHLVEPEEPTPKEQAAEYEIRTLQSLRDIWPEFFKSTNAQH